MVLAAQSTAREQAVETSGTGIMFEDVASLDAAARHPRAIMTMRKTICLCPICTHKPPRNNGTRQTAKLHGGRPKSRAKVETLVQEVVGMVKVECR